MKLLRLTTGLLLALSTFATTSCLINGCKGDDEPAPADDSVQVSYTQTQCSDRWGQAAGTQQLETVAGAYLQQQGIVAQKLTAAVSGPPAACAACQCPTGVVLTATVRPADLQAMLSLGFKQ